MRSGRVVTAVFAVAVAASFALHAQTNVYRWVDRDGKVHFSDAPPPADAKDSSSRRMGGGDGAAPQMPFATQQAMKRNPATLFVSNDCAELCASGRALLARRGVPFTERNAQTSAEAAAEVKKLVGAMQVPVLLLGQNPVKGFDEDLWNAALDGAGYARTALPGQNLPAPSAPAR
jgi:glutaredoxin